MYLWSSKKIISRLAQGEISDWEATKYLLLLSVFTTLTTSYINPLDLELLDWIGRVLASIIIIFGICICFNANKNGDNKDFIKRYIVLTWPAFIRFYIVGMSLYAMILIASINSDTTIGLFFISDYFKIIYLVIFEILYFVLLRFYFKCIFDN